MYEFDEALANRKHARICELGQYVGPHMPEIFVLIFAEVLETRRDIARLHGRISQLPKEFIMQLTDDPNYQQLLSTVNAIKGTADSTKATLERLGAWIQQLLTSGNNGGPDTSALKDLAVALQEDNQEILDAITNAPQGGATGATGTTGAQTASAKQQA